MTDLENRRVAGFRFGREDMIHWLLRDTNFAERFPGATHVAVNYDFDCDCFTFKFRHPTLDAISDGEMLPILHPAVEKRNWPKF